MAAADDPNPPGTAVETTAEKLRTGIFASLDRSLPGFSEERRVATASGAIGKVLGDATHQAGSIAFVAVIGLLLILTMTILGMFFISAAIDDKLLTAVGGIIQSLIALVGTILGYIFGKSVSK